MNRYEFTDTLRKSISAVNDYQFVNDTVKYYEDYIDSNLAKGLSEESIMETLGDPRLIAKSIMATKQTVTDDDTQTGYAEQEQRADIANNKVTFMIKGHKVTLPMWSVKALGIGAVVLLLILIIGIARVLFVPAVVIFIIISLVRFIKDNF